MWSGVEPLTLGVRLARLRQKTLGHAGGAAQVSERACVSIGMGMWWPERTPKQRDDRLDESKSALGQRRGGVVRIDTLLEERKGVQGWPAGPGKEVLLRAIDDLIRESLARWPQKWLAKSSR